MMARVSNSGEWIEKMIRKAIDKGEE